MRINVLILTASLLFPAAALAQAPPPPKMGPGDAGPVTMHRRMMMTHREMGKWWKNSEVAKKLQLNDGQVAQLDQIFYQHRLKLIDFGAEMEKEDLKLQTLLDADVPNEGQVGAQVDQVLGARGKLEREFTMMNLDLRKVLSVDQWRQLKAIREERGTGHDVFFYYRTHPPDAPPAVPGEPAPPFPPPGPGEMF
jgi:Spy/CpxP family protein refolding chaperone